MYPLFKATQITNEFTGVLVSYTFVKVPRRLSFNPHMLIAAKSLANAIESLWRIIIAVCILLQNAGELSYNQ